MKKRNLRNILAFLAFAFLHDVRAEGESVYDQYFNFMGFTLENSNLYEVREKLGKAPIYEEGDAADYTAGICYSFKNKSAIVYFESGELGGDKHYLQSFTLSQAKENEHECGILNINVNEVEIGRLKIGMPINEAHLLLPKPITKFSYGAYHQHTNLVKVKASHFGDEKIFTCEENIFIQVKQDGGFINRLLKLPPHPRCSLESEGESSA